MEKSHSPSLSDIEASICRFIQTALAVPEGIPEGETLSDIGIDSFQLMEIGIELEKEFGVKFPLSAYSSEAVQSVTSFAQAYQKILNDDYSDSTSSI